MNDEAKKYLAELLAKSPADITEPEMVFLKARRSYLTEEQLINFGLVESPKMQPGDETPVSNEEVPSKPRQRRKALQESAE